MASDAERLMQTKRTLGGVNAALNRARQHEHEMFVLLAEMYDALPAAERMVFKDRYEKEAVRARKGNRS